MSTDEVKDEVREADKQAFRPFGLTKREYFAAMAMQGLLANAHYVEGIEDDFPDEQAHQEEHVALRSVIFADALLAALEASK